MSEPTWKYNNDEEKKLAEEIINMEKTVLAKFFNGDMTGYDDLWSKKVLHIMMQLQQKE